MTSLRQRFAAQAARRPDALALQIGDRRWTGRDLATLARTSARQFRADGLGESDFIGWLGHNSAEMLAALLACSQIGVVFVPLNWRLAAAELAAIACHAGLSALRHTPELAALAAQVRALAPGNGRSGAFGAAGVTGAIGATGATGATGAIDATASAQPGDVLLVYTSGSSGQPKGVLHSQRGMLANIDIALAVQGLSAADRVLAVLPLCHVGGLCIQVLPALAVGAAVKLQPRFDARAWLHDVATLRPGTSLLVPAVMRALLAHPAWPATDLRPLRFVNSGSSIVPLNLIEAFHARGVPVAQVYGSTETGPFSVALRPHEALRHAGSVGHPAPGVRLRLVDAQGQTMPTQPTEPTPPTPPTPPVGQAGEIQLQAPKQMRGYHRLPAGRGFVDGWFATGDLAWADAQGRLTVVGRCSDRIISGGENIYPAEIENLAAAWPGVAEAAVIGLPDARWGEVPVLVLVPMPGVAVDLPALRAHFHQHLARYKHPQTILLAEHLPKTALGKVQKSALRQALLEKNSAPTVD